MGLVASVMHLSLMGTQLQPVWDNLVCVDVLDNGSGLEPRNRNRDRSLGKVAPQEAAGGRGGDGKTKKGRGVPHVGGAPTVAPRAAPPPPGVPLAVPPAMGGGHAGR